VKKLAVGAVVVLVGILAIWCIYQFRSSRLTAARMNEIRVARERLASVEETEKPVEEQPVPPPNQAAKPQLIARIRTTKGPITIRLLPDKAPVTVANFVNLATQDFYDGLTFHRVIADFMIQGGDPEGTGRGGPGYRFEDEFDPSLRFDRAGLLAMANAGPGTNGSQFFITHSPQPHLNQRHTIFGEVIEGQEVVDTIQQGDKMEDIEIEGDYAVLFEQLSDRIAQWNAKLGN
jgi:peptidyl-prolyl cis-trans isomerase B (cyclophilin B)